MAAEYLGAVAVVKRRPLAPYERAQHSGL